MENPYTLNINQIRNFLPHRAPFLLVDRILEIHPVENEKARAEGDIFSSAEVGTRVVGIKNVTYNEPYFQGHFPKFSILPGVILIETMAQVASFSVYPSLLKRSEEINIHQNKDIDRLFREFQCILIGVDQARFRKPVIPGDTLRIETVVSKRRGKLWGFDCTALVEGQKVAEAAILANLIANSD